MREIKSFILLIAILCSASVVWSQDIIVLKSTEEIKALVQEVGLTDVKYKKYENADGPSYTLLKSDIFMIKYANGGKDVFNDAPDVSETEKQPGKDPNTSVEFLKLQTAIFKSVTAVDSKGKKYNNAELLELLSDTPDALSHYKDGQQRVLIGDICAFSGLGLCLGGLGLLAIDVDNNLGIAAGFIIAGGVIGLTGMLLDSSGCEEIRKALSLYYYGNRGTPNAYSLNFGLTKSGGIGLTFKF
jgi:hypothetical protein